MTACTFPQCGCTDSQWLTCAKAELPRYDFTGTRVWGQCSPPRDSSLAAAVAHFKQRVADAKSSATHAVHSGEIA